MLTKSLFTRVLARTPTRWFAAPPAKGAPPAPPAAPVTPQTGPIEIPEQYQRDKTFFPQYDPSIKREFTFHSIKTLHDALKKQLDIAMVEENLMPAEKVVIHPLRLRHELDTLDHLHSKRLVPLLINPRGDLPGIDCVLDQTQVKALRSTPNFYYRPIYVKVGNEEIRCTLDRLVNTPDKANYFKVYLNRYVVGQPNQIKVELTVPVTAHLGLRQKQIEWHRQEFPLICYNDVFPAKIELDEVRLLRNGKITFGDLQNLLPRGLELLPIDKTRLKFSVVSLVELNSKKEADSNHRHKLIPIIQEKEVVAQVVVDFNKALVDMSPEELAEWEKEQKKRSREKLGLKPLDPTKKSNRVSSKDRIREESQRMRAALEAKLAKAEVLMADPSAKKK